MWCHGKLFFFFYPPREGPFLVQISLPCTFSHKRNNKVIRSLPIIIRKHYDLKFLLFFHPLSPSKLYSVFWLNNYSSCSEIAWLISGIKHIPLHFLNCSFFFLSETNWLLWVTIPPEATFHEDNVFWPEVERGWKATYLHVELLKFLEIQPPARTVLEESFVPLFELMLIKLCALHQVLHHFRGQFAILFPHSAVIALRSAT